MAFEVLNYVLPKRRRRIPWYHWSPLAVLVLSLLASTAIFVYAWLHWNDPRCWDM